MQTAEIKRRFLNFFEERNHTVVPSASLVSDDPTVMFTIAGMVPFIPYMTGVVPAPWPRATSVQKCIRTNDIEEVGRTPRHGTFFQMCGNFSFGDYFKREAIEFAWTFLTASQDDGGLGFNPHDLWVTVYRGDEDAYRYWREIAGIPEERIQRLGEDTNYWSAGKPGGPAGPDSEIFFDRGPAYGIDGGPATDDDRYVEIWNLVFMQYERGADKGDGTFELLGELPQKNIDTGMGLERIAFLLQGVENMYEIDQVRPVLDLAASLSGKAYGGRDEDDVRMRVIADHVRSALMLIGDGVQPGNEGRGYILRRLLRRVVRNMRLLGVEEATFPQLFPASMRAMKDAYPELERDFDRISRTAYAEEEAFLRTLAQGTTIFEEAVSGAKSSGSAQLAGDVAFKLHDTYGFPIDLTMEMAEEAGLKVNRDKFNELMTEQRERAKADAKSRRSALADLSVYKDFRALGETAFVGYDELRAESEVLGIIVDGESSPVARSGQVAEIIVAETTLYAEAGGQDADQGWLIAPSGGFEARVDDVQKPVAGLIAHTVTVTEGEIAVGERVETVVDEVYRRQASEAHTATHLIHAALRDTLGPDAHQSGSYNKAGYMRLDFTWSQPLSKETRIELEEISNAAVRADYEIITKEMALADAKALGARALFGEKYGSVVRMVEIGGPWSRELCGGTHVAGTSEVGLVNLIGESSVGSQNRRVEAFVGRNAFADFATERAIVRELSSGLKVPREKVTERVEDLLQGLKRAEKKIAQLEAAALRGRVPELVGGAAQVGSIAYVGGSLGTVGSADDVRQLVLDVRERLGSEASVVALGGESNGKPIIVIATNEASRELGVKAGALVKLAAGILGGGGGGKPDVAQGGGQDAAKLPEALEAVRRELQNI
ncbi:alanine--tRNA ligase [Gulosibacter molinativorax]|uniref:Alanine--tRNA ligase n=1 Tax=Gulosibacter molinativorax TaxID=256821 RepID=A0ABT7C8G6_9MICO|nr:alanine--tRNA ligase [Gulosibacter molinativorax]MDJ1371054.1 alanine--tRNA ligase [Gulosibacter molinativorax]QUY61414.1 Alanine--tRNA ligase [Gulosibacter molinativorax]